MRIRDSRMPDETYWETLFDVPLTLSRFNIQRYRDVAELGCGYGTFSIPVASAISGTLYTFDVEPAMLDRTRERGLGALVEVHDESELDVALAAGASLVGVNHRNLRTFEIDLGLTTQLASRVPPEVLLVAESGIFTHDHVEQLRSAGAQAFLVGESLMREPQLGPALRRLRGRP